MKELPQFLRGLERVVDTEYFKKEIHMSARDAVGVVSMYLLRVDCPFSFADLSKAVNESKSCIDFERIGFSFEHVMQQIDWAYNFKQGEASARNKVTWCEEALYTLTMFVLCSNVKGLDVDAVRCFIHAKDLKVDRDGLLEIIGAGSDLEDETILWLSRILPE
ncbi:hypothetical protein ACQKQC_06420 [Vibrio fortis]|uniref:hypothetical protein n=1 Tax=Vibrio fortis TaxID=212667 RepID=UPI0040681AC8